MKFDVVRSVPFGEIARYTRREFHHLPMGIEGQGGTCTLILFRFQRDEKADGVVTSNDVAKALRRIGAVGGEPIFAFAGAFTVEAAAILDEGGGRAIALGSFTWTDESIRRIHSTRPRS